MEYYSLPFKPSQAIKQAALEKVEIRTSIHQNIRLLLESFFLSYRFDPTFGSYINKYQGSTKPNATRDKKWRAEIQRHIQQNLESLMMKYENRVEISQVIVNLVSPSKDIRNESVLVRVEVDGRLTLGLRKKFHFPDSEIAEEAMEVFPLTIPVGKD